MAKSWLRATYALIACAVLAAGAILIPPASLCAQEPLAAPGVKFKVQGAAERLEMTVNTSRILEFEFDVPKMLVNNPDLVRVIPISPRSVQISAIRAGVTQVNVWDDKGKVTSIDLVILGDVQELDLILKTEFPEANVRLRPLNSSLFVTGFVPRAEMVPQITRIAQDYFPQIVNNLTVGGVQKVLLHVKIMEVSRTKLRAVGVDWASVGSNHFISQGVSGALAATAGVGAGIATTPAGPSTVRFGIVDGNTQFYGFLELLRQNNLAKLLAEPTLTTLNGRPASFNVGGEVPILVPQSLGTVTIQYREFGTQVDFVPIVLGNGLVRLEVRPQITELDNSLSVNLNGTSIPGFRQRRADVGVEMRAGQTLAIAGLVYTRTEASNRGIPWLADLPWFGVPFRHVQERQNEVELVILVTPEFAEAMDPNEVPACGPGQTTASPTDVELYYRGYLEVPKKCDSGNCDSTGAPIRTPEELEPGFSAPYGASSNRPQTTQPVSRQVSAPAAQPSYSGTPARTVATGTGVKTALQSSAPQPATNGNYSYYAGSSQPAARTAQAPKPSQQARPALIGPLGYDELK
ncbi:Putative type II secretion system protein D precursor [Anatilimnocola aggregata]|uniref:Type II secretion system protein D n=1 Tax=Anatilimnocola aggregata TaxID=2528021 RepID=A0A517Y6U3_9BACT|nr:pilus assembly protein N-terminal domain-containing protein [Anatilimnocola aggregata]QDU25951.1 Putative type II secretion system protein D precursor [Anatilimnocola aggregata]